MDIHVIVNLQAEVSHEASAVPGLAFFLPLRPPPWFLAGATRVYGFPLRLCAAAAAL